MLAKWQNLFALNKGFRGCALRNVPYSSQRHLGNPSASPEHPGRADAWEGIPPRSAWHMHTWGKQKQPLSLEINYLSSRRVLLGKTWPWTTQEEAVSKRCLGATAGKPASSTGHTGLGGHHPHITGSGCDQTQMGELQWPPLLREKKCWRSDKDGSSPLRYPG